MRFYARLLEDDHVRLEPLREVHREALRPLADDEALWLLTTERGDGKWFDRWFSDQLDRHARGLQISHAVYAKAQDAYAGHTAYLALAPEQARLEIGWTWYAEAFRGGVVNPAAKRLLLENAFDQGAERVELKTNANNAASRAAIAKLGAAEEGVLRSHSVTWTGERRDVVYFSILKPEWPDVRARLDARLGDTLQAAPSAVSVLIDDPARAPVAALLAIHGAHAEAHSPLGSCHYFNAERLDGDDVTLWTACEGDAVLGCVALQERLLEHPGEEPERAGELKSLHVAEAARGRGVARLLVETVLDAARARAMKRVLLETGSSDGFAASRALYEAMGFAVVGPFAEYSDNGFSVFMARSV